MGQRQSIQRPGDRRFYVHRTRDDREGWVGPLRGRNRADAEAAAWTGEGWTAEVHESTPAVRAQVRAWQRAADIRHGRVA